MATAYTSLLGLALPVTGELSGAWGDVVNDSITSLLDSAISGTTSLTTDADVTLTTTTGAANQARQAIILWNPASGTTTRNITAPAQSKIYTVINASGGTQSIVFRGVGPTTGVTIVKGESAVVAWNGTDFIKVSNTSGAGSFTTLSASGAVTLGGGTANGVAYLNGSKVLTTGSALTYNGTGLGINRASASCSLDIQAASTSDLLLLRRGGSSATAFSASGDGVVQWGNGTTDAGFLGWDNGLARVTATGQLYLTTNAGSSAVNALILGLTGNAAFAGNVSISAGGTAFLTGSLGSRLWTPGLAIGTATYSGLYGPSLTYLAERDGSTWRSSGGGAAGALGIDEGHFYFARSQGVAGPGEVLTWTTFLESGSNGDFAFNSTGFTKVASGTTAARPFASAGRVRWNTSLGQLEVGDGSNFEKVLLDTIATSASGGTITTSGDYRIHTFTSSGTFTLTTVSGGGNIDIQVLVVGGGGGGGFYLGGGGGGGAMLEQVVSVPAGSYTVTVGAGGTAVDSGFTYSGNGGQSSITSSLVNLYAYGGGAGGNGFINDAWGANGSSSRDIGSGGGGGSPFGATIANGTIGLALGGAAGHNGSGGGFGTTYNGSSAFNGGGGGGGALGAGVAPNVGNGPVGGGGLGGNGRPSSITGSNVFYGGGGGGGYGTYLGGLIGGGLGGGGAGAGSGDPFTTSATAGSANLGGGGGGGQSNSGYRRGGAGGSGVVIIRYKFQ